MSICETCSKVFTLNRILRRHHRLFNAKPSSSIKCLPCNRYFTDQSNYKQNILQHSKMEEKHLILLTENFLSGIKFKVVELLWSMTQKHDSIKLNFEIFCEYMLVLSGS